MRVSKSRNVCGYVKAVQQRDKLQAKLNEKLEALKPLERAVNEAAAAVHDRRQKLTGGHFAEAERILRGQPNLNGGN